MSEEETIRKLKSNRGRKSKASEFGLADLMLHAWPEEKRRENIAHIAGYIGNTEMIAGKFGPMHLIDPRVQVSALELLLKYGYGTPRAIDVTVDFDLNADVEKMTDAEREIYKLKLQQYMAKKGIQT
jgi:hypothetical protein